LCKLVYVADMLYLSRKVGESIVINNTIVMTVMEVKGKTAKIGFSFPPDVSILRKEIYDRITEENTAAMSSSAADLLSDDLELLLEMDWPDTTAETETGKP
jgi:carbon storage regulator